MLANLPPAANQANVQIDCKRGAWMEEKWNSVLVLVPIVTH